MSTPSTDDRDAVIHAVEQMTTAFMEGRIDDVMVCYEADAVVMFEPAQPVRDPAAMRLAFQEMAALKPRYRYPEGHDVEIVGDLALHIAAWELTATLPDGSPLEQKGLSTAVLRRDARGEWKLVIDNPHGQLPFERMR